TDGKVVVSLTAKAWAAAKELLDKSLDGKQVVAAEKAFKLTRSQLPDDATVLIVGETGATITTLVDTMRGAGEAIPGFPRLGTIKPVKGEPTYVGGAVTLKGEVVTLTAFVPTGAIAVGRKMLE